MKAAVLDIGQEMAQEALVGTAYAGAVCVGDLLGLGTISRLAVGVAGGVRGLYHYSQTATAALDSPILGKTLAFTLGASIAMMAGLSGNLLSGAAVGAGLGLINGTKPYFSQS